MRLRTYPNDDKSAIKNTLTEVLGEGGKDEWIERDGDKEHEEHTRKHYQPHWEMGGGHGL